MYNDTVESTQIIKITSFSFSEAYIDQDGRIPFKMESPVGSEGEFQERMEYLADAIKKMINTVNTERETSRLQHLTISSELNL